MRAGVVIAILVLVVTVPTIAAEVRLRSAVGCRAAVVRLADVAEVFAEDARVGSALAEITLCPAPAPGGKRLLSQAEVQELLALSGVDRKTANVTGSETVTVTAESHSRSATGAKQPLVAAGLRQAAFEADVEASRKPAARAVVKSQAALQPEDKDQKEPPVVEKGAIVTVSARTAGVKITTSGKALDDGATGDTIGVELTDGKQRVVARVSGPQTVEVTQ
jgi:flagella basal body P-ring formation protein FlgA